MTVSDATPAASPNSEALLNIVRAILLSQDREQLEALEQELHTLTSSTNISQQAQTARTNAIFEKLTELDDKTQANADIQQLAERLTPVMTGLIRRTIQDSPDEMAEAIGPVMGEAIRVQIRDSRKEMVEAIYPIIGETIQRAISEFSKELQRSIDARLKSPLTPKGFVKRLRARFSGISNAELALREALPFNISEIFLIQHHSGLLLAHQQPDGGEGHDSDLIGAMLTAIRDFVQDAFKSNSASTSAELGEISFGDMQISIESGQHIYLAIVYSGIAPEGFHAELHQFIADLHVQHSAALRNYAGDPATLPNLAPALGALARPSPVEDQARPLSRGQKYSLAGAAIGAVLLLTLACFYLWFTINLWPLAFPKATPTSTASPTATATATLTATPTATATATDATTSTLIPSATHTLTATQPIPSPTISVVYTTGNVNLRASPQIDAKIQGVLLVDTPVQILAIYGDWVQVNWQNGDEMLAGWISSRWVQLPEEFPASIVTPTTSAP